MKKIYFILITFSVLVFSTLVFAQVKTYKIGILVWEKTEQNDDAMAGLLKGIELSGLSADLNIQQAENNENEARHILSTWQDENIDLICAIGTKAAATALEEIQDIPIVSTGVTNSLAMGSSKGQKGQRLNITGSSNWIDSKILLTTFKKTIPHLKTLGVIFDPNNPAVMEEVTEAEKKCQSSGITLIQAHITNVGEIKSSVERLITQKIDALWVPRTKLVYENMDSIGRITHLKKLPVVSSTAHGVGLHGSIDNAVGIVAVTVDYEVLGRSCVPAIIEILNESKNAGDIPIRQISDYQIIINKNTADAIDYEIPMTILAEADMVIKGFTGQKIVIAGTGDSQELLRVIARAFEKKLEGGKIEVPDSVGSSGGIRAVINDEADIARVARALKKDEQQAGLNYLLFAEAPVVFAVHPDVTGIDNITTEEIIKIYSGQVKNWNVLGYQVGKIYPINRESGDSCLKVLLAKVPGFADIPDPIGKIFYSTQEAVDAIAEHKQTIGFLPLPSTIDKNIRILKVDGVYPSVENVQSGKYNLAVPLAAVYKKEPRGLAKKFIEFLFSPEAKEIITAAGSVPVK